MTNPNLERLLEIDGIRHLAADSGNDDDYTHELQLEFQQLKSKTETEHNEAILFEQMIMVMRNDKKTWSFNEAYHHIEYLIQNQRTEQDKENAGKILDEKRLIKWILNDIAKNGQKRDEIITGLQKLYQDLPEDEITKQNEQIVQRLRERIGELQKIVVHKHHAVDMEPDILKELKKLEGTN